ncbi:MAG TPA: DUF4166 domain-containing protein [Telluria sp.]|jgi:hypothetical protein
MSKLVETWFGPAFDQLDPLLQALHRKGGVLAGPVSIVFGPGIAGVLGRSIARRAGIPTEGALHQLRVAIHSADGVLHWNRSFDGQSVFTSHFIPVGNYPAGHWMEATGSIGLQLGVAIVAGGWHWQHLASTLRGVRVPTWLMPRMQACKQIRDGRYHFAVSMALPLLGTLLSYGGKLELETERG